MWVVVTVVVVVVLVATYVTWIATRVDRLHARAAAAYDTLGAQSRRRATAAEELGRRHGIADVQTAAKAVLTGRLDDSEQAENDLTRRLREALPSVAEPDPGAEAVVEASRRFGVARQVYTDLVRDARGVRRHPFVRMLRLARRHPQPRFFDIDEPTLDA